MTTRYDVNGTQGMFEPESSDLVLANKLGVRDPADIDEAELVLLQKLYESVLRDHLPQGRISVQHLKIWHRRWLGNVYAWAGQVRTVNMSKGGFPFAPAAQIPRLLEDFDRDCLARYTPCTDYGHEQLVEAIAVTHVEFILMHPFREGNGRISRLLADVMAVQAGHGPLDYSSWEQNKPDYIIAIQQGLGRNYESMKLWTERALESAHRLER
ncbi:MAG: Fic family protein [Pusillimonas sp.]